MASLTPGSFSPGRWTFITLVLIALPEVALLCDPNLGHGITWDIKCDTKCDELNKNVVPNLSGLKKLVRLSVCLTKIKNVNNSDYDDNL